MKGDTKQTIHKGRWLTLKEMIIRKVHFDPSYPWLWGADLKSTYKSIWLGWWLITYTTDPLSNFNISFQPGL